MEYLHNYASYVNTGKIPATQDGFFFLMLAYSCFLKTP